MSSNNGGVNLLSRDSSGLITIREDNRKTVCDAIDKSLVRALEKVGLTAEGYAKRLCPVDTGRLRNSVTHQVSEDEKAVYIGTNVEYAIYVELGRYAQPFLVPAITDHLDKYVDIVKSELGG